MSVLAPTVRDVSQTEAGREPQTTGPGARDDAERGRRAFEATALLRSQLDATLPVTSSHYLRALAAEGLTPKEMMLRVDEDTGGAVRLRGALLGKLLVGEAWMGGEIVTPRKAARNQALAAEADATSAGTLSPGRSAWKRTTHIRDAATAGVGRPAYERAMAGFVARRVDPAKVLTWLRTATGGAVTIDEHLAEQVLQASVWASAVRAGLIADPIATSAPSRVAPPSKDSSRRTQPPPTRATSPLTSEQASAKAPRRKDAAPKPTVPPSHPRRSPRRARARSAGQVARDEKRLDAAIGQPAAEFILKHMRISMSRGMTEAEACEHVAVSLIARGGRHGLTGEEVLDIAAANGWQTEAARRAKQGERRRKEARSRAQASRRTTPATGRDSAGSVWARLARTSHARFVGGGLPGLGKRR